MNFIDKYIEFSVGSFSVQRLYKNLSVFCLVNIVFSLNLNVIDYLFNCVINDL